MSGLTELQKDLDELVSLSSQAQRQKVKDVLNTEVSRLKAQIDLEKRQVPQALPKEETKEIKTNKDDFGKLDEFVTITNYSFDQEGKSVKVYLFLQEIENVPKENITFETKSDSFDLKIFNYKGKNHRFTIKKLCGTIDPTGSKFIHKSGKIVLTLKKEKSDHWDQLIYKDKPFNPDKKEKTEDPNAAMMNMMKKLYEEGDDDMKRTIAQSWTKAQDEKKTTGKVTEEQMPGFKFV